MRIVDCRQQVFIPNIITPNGDGRNDRLEIVGIDKERWALSIYNRWGTSVYQTYNYHQEWNATGLANGLYYYLLRSSKEGQQIKGWIEVRR